MSVYLEHGISGQNQIKTEIFCVTYELLFYRDITKLLRFPVVLLGTMLWPALWSMAWLSPSPFSIAETPCKTNTGCKTGFEMPYWNFEACFRSECFLPSPPPICQRRYSNLRKGKSVLWEENRKAQLVKADTKRGYESTEQNHWWKIVFKLNAHVASGMSALIQVENS